MFFRVPSKGALPPGSPCRVPVERDAPFPESSIIRLPKSPVKRPPPPSFQTGPFSRAFVYISLEVPNKQGLLTKSHLYLKVSSKVAPLRGPPTGPLWREMPLSRAFFYISLEVPNKQGLLIKSHLYLKVFSKVAPLHGPPTGPLWREMPLSRAFFYISPEVPIKQGLLMKPNFISF